MSNLYTSDTVNKSDEWFSRIAEGDEQAFTEAFYFYNRRIYPYLLKKVKSDDIAREMVQDVFLKLWLLRERLNDIPNPEAYLFRMAANLLGDFYRKSLHEYHMKNVMSKKSERTQDGDTDLWRSETKRLLNEAVEELPSERKKVYRLRMDGYSYDEIAEVLDLSVNTVRNQLVSATKTLKEILRQKGLSVLVLILFWKDI